jgi:arylsulfatase A-like enzyme
MQLRLATCSQQAGYLQAYRKSMNNAVTLGKIFKMAGYTTMWSGKHHSAELPTTRGLDYYSGLFEGLRITLIQGKGVKVKGKQLKNDLQALVKYQIVAHNISIT